MNIGLLLSFLAGIASVISPCVLPLIPIVIGYSMLNKRTSEISFFVIGFFSIFMLIILLTAVFTASINYYLYYFRITAAILIIAIGIFFILDKSAFKLSYRPIKHKNAVLESFSMGVLTSLAWAPCYGAYLIAVITYSASTGDFIYSAFNMMIYTAGFSLTIFIIAFLASKINITGLIKYSKWVRVISGVIILIAGIYMLFGLIGVL